MSWLGLDIGGANLKAADGAGWARSVPFALWRDPQGLSRALRSLVDSAPAADRLVVTMTGELCDCFRSKADGVRHILVAVQEVAAQREVRVYLVDGRLVAIAEARDSPHLAAASNWRALAKFACRFVASGPGLLIDVGSTTTDIIPLVDGQVAARGRNDTERLAARELLYSGVGRTPVSAVTDSLPWRGQPCPIAAEVFSTTADAYLLLREIEENPHANWTADGRPLIIECARQRLARQLCADAGELAAEDFQRIALAVREAHLRQLEASLAAVIDEMPGLPGVFVVSGTGEFLAQAALGRLLPGRRIKSLRDMLGPQISRCAPSHAIALLAAEVGKMTNTPLSGGDNA